MEACCFGQECGISTNYLFPAFELFVLAVIFHFRRFNSASVVVKTGAIVKLFSHTAILSIVPAGYELYLSTGEGDTWKLVASGKNAGSVQIISFPAEATSKFKIVQTGTKGNFR